jgi:hypothetical protein
MYQRTWQTDPSSLVGDSTEPASGYNLPSGWRIACGDMLVWRGSEEVWQVDIRKSATPPQRTATNDRLRGGLRGLVAVPVALRVTFLSGRQQW